MVRVIVDGRPVEIEAHNIGGRMFAEARRLLELVGCEVGYEPGPPEGMLVIRTRRQPEPALDLDLRLPSFATASQLDAYARNTPLAGWGQRFVEAEAKWRVSAAFLFAVACHESDFGRSRLAQEKFNLFGWRAYDRSPRESAARFRSWAESIDFVAGRLAVLYLTPGGLYYSEPTLRGVARRYATDPQWADKVLRHWRGIVREGVA